MTAKARFVSAVVKKIDLVIHTGVDYFILSW